MDSGHQTQSCKKCGAPLEKGFVGIATGMCFSCVRASDLAGQTTSTQAEEAAGTDEPGQSPQSEAEEATGGDKTEVAPIEGEPTDNRKRRIRPAAAKGADGKLTPACASCKKSKIRCTHRRVLTEDVSNVPSKKRKREADAEAPGVKDNAGKDNDTSAGVGADDQNPPPKKRALRIRLKDNHEGGKARSESPPLRPAESEVVDSSKRQAQGGRRKRKRADDEEEVSADASSSTAAAAVSEAEAGTVEVTNPPRKRSRRERKRDEVVVEQTASDAAAPPVVESAAARPPPTAPGSRAFPSFPTDSLEGAALLSRHTVLSRQLQQRLEDCETKWVAAIESLQAAKEALDTWVEVWREGL